MYVIQNDKASENLLLYIFKHDISRKSAVQLNSCCFFVVKRSKLQCSGNHQNIQICFLLFLLFGVKFCCETSFDVFIIFSELSGLKGNVLFMEIYIPMKSLILSITKYAIFMYKKKKKKVIFLTDYKRSYFPNFSLVLSANLCINCTCLWKD